jgi:hypothetical protein
LQICPMDQRASHDRSPRRSTRCASLSQGRRVAGENLWESVDRGKEFLRSRSNIISFLPTGHWNLWRRSSQGCTFVRCAPFFYLDRIVDET